MAMRRRPRGARVPRPSRPRRRPPRSPATRSSARSGRPPILAIPASPPPPRAIRHQRRSNPGGRGLAKDGGNRRWPRRSSGPAAKRGGSARSAPSRFPGPREARENAAVVRDPGPVPRQGEGNAPGDQDGLQHGRAGRRRVGGPCAGRCPATAGRPFAKGRGRVEVWPGRQRCSQSPPRTRSRGAQGHARPDGIRSGPSLRDSESPALGIRSNRP